MSSPRFRPMIDDPAEAIRSNYAKTFELIARHSTVAFEPPRRFEQVLAVPTGSPSAFYNPILALHPESALDHILAADDWMRGLGLETSVHAVEEIGLAVETILEARGFNLDSADPAMIVTPIPASPAPPAGLTIEVVHGDDLAGWQRTFAGDESAVERVGLVFGPGFADDPSVCLFAGRLDGRIVATSIAVVGARSVGVYAVATEESMRGRGIGSAMTWTCLEFGRSWGCDAAALQSSKMGLRLYERISFRTVTTYRLYMPGG